MIMKMGKNWRATKNKEATTMEQNEPKPHNDECGYMIQLHRYSTYTGFWLCRFSLMKTQTALWVAEVKIELTDLYIPLWFFFISNCEIFGSATHNRIITHARIFSNCYKTFIQLQVGAKIPKLQFSHLFIYRLLSNNYFNAKTKSRDNKSKWKMHIEQ